MRCLTITAAFIALAASAAAQSFTLSEPTPQLQASTPGAYFTLEPPPARLSFFFVPPARRMFVDQTGDVSLFPSLFPAGAHFHRLDGPAPGFFTERFQGSFTAYRIGDHYLALQAGYTLHSATIRNGRLFVMAKDSDGRFVALSPAHIALARADGTLAELEEAAAAPSVVSLLVDRSASIVGYDGEIAGAVTTLADTLAPEDRCALYEFGQRVRTVQRPDTSTCGALFTTYRMSSPGGGTPLYEAMARAYADLASEDALAAVVVISDGAPSDRPGPGLADAAVRVPTLVLWVGNHTEDHIAGYSTSHAVSRDGARDEVEDFLRAVSVSVRAHQAFAISSP